ncbi:damage-control phosphatase ARMT1-like isoform X2 [Sitodiplosis mosellana]|uniref:damage-control phosphatase ARMT1-like isoform X2 n=1 Tax=Sitodiplosis mosellana TaxID=263140 RepID=UPI0024449CFB|nr:damage-control phosphatase ARMT1-like isoform X2 [Sitodiplosis mosellana]
MSGIDVIIDEATPVNATFAAKYKRSAAYQVFTENLPNLLTKLIDRLAHDKDEIAKIFSGEQTKADIEEAIANILQLKHELLTDKQLTPLDDDEVDNDVWNTFIGQLGENNTYFTTRWIYAYCYVYRRLKSIFGKTTLKSYDYFQKQKDSAFDTSMNAISTVIEQTAEFYSKHATSDESSINELERFFYKLLRVNLWSNRDDLTLISSIGEKKSSNPFVDIESFESYLLVDRSRDIWNCLQSGPKSCAIDVVMDNAGYELFTDFLLADFVLYYNLANKVRFHCKAIPWFVSDVTYRDFHWTIRQFAESNVPAIQAFGQRLQQHVATNRIELRWTTHFWSSPYEFQAMPTIAPKLYALLETSHMVIIKGDLNYRKLFADKNWPYDSRFTEVLGAFRPTNVCSLRTTKVELICELSEEKAKKLFESDEMWMLTGEYGVIQFAPKPQ